MLLLDFFKGGVEVKELLRIEQISKCFGDFYANLDISLEVRRSTDLTGGKWCRKIHINEYFDRLISTDKRENISAWQRAKDCIS